MFDKQQPNSKQQVDSHLLIGGHLKPLEDFSIIDDDDISNFTESSTSLLPWRVLVVDDDEEVHEATEFALKNIIILGRSVELLHAYSAEEGFNCIKNRSDIAVALLDVVMESEDAGLQLVEKIRGHGFQELRIVLRTGQPGYAPELSVLSDYDINDYRTKSELTRNRLVSLLTTSFRSYRQLHIINESRRGLGLIVKSARDIFKRNNLELFSQGVLTQLISLLGAPTDGIACLLANEDNITDEKEKFTVVTATGRFQDYINKSLDDIVDLELNQTFSKAKNSEVGIYIADVMGLYFSSSQGKKLFVFVSSCSDFNEEHINLLKVFASNIAIGFENLTLIEGLDKLAYLDPILGLPNRNSFELEFDRYKATKKDLAVVLVHVNSLSQSISVFGLPVVNQALIEVNRRLASEVIPAPFAIAYDGKADLILLVNSKNLNINDINSIFESRIKVEQFTLPWSATISVVQKVEDLDAQTALRFATSAMIIAKSTPGTNIMYYDHSMSQGLTERILLQSSFRHALESRVGIEAFLQPKVNCDDETVIGAEALCRWDFDGRTIGPGDFIPIAEASGLSGKVTDFMVEEIAEFAQQRQLAGLPVMPVALNLSMLDLLTHNFGEILHQKFIRLGLSPATVDLEITESAMMRDPEQSIAELMKLKNLGYSIAIDDFGTGYSSLNYLERLPVNCLKIDKTFIDTLDQRSAKQSLVATAITLAKHMDLTVIAEGIETKAQHDALKLLNCQACQGFYFGEPLPMAEFNSTYRLGEPCQSNHFSAKVSTFK